MDQLTHFMVLYLCDKCLEHECTQWTSSISRHKVLQLDLAPFISSLDSTS